MNNEKIESIQGRLNTIYSLNKLIEQSRCELVVKQFTNDQGASYSSICFETDDIFREKIVDVLKEKRAAVIKELEDLGVSVKGD